MKPTVADSRTPNRLILPVTTEAAGSSPVVPAIFSNSCKNPSPSQLHKGCTTVRPETAPFTAFLTSGSTSAGLT